MRQWTVDAFASGPFKGNPACVLEPFDAWPDAAWMQALAAENNQAETAFLLKTGDGGPLRPALVHPGGGGAAVRPRHPGLGPCAAAPSFSCAAGGGVRHPLRRPLTCRAIGEGWRWISPPIRRGGSTRRRGWQRPSALGRWRCGRAAYLVALLADEAAVRGLRPDLAAIADRRRRDGRAGQPGVAAPGGGGLGPMMWSAASSPPARAFPRTRRQARPIASSRPCSPASSAARRLRFHQAYPGRGGDIEAELKGERVLLRGRAVTMIESRLQDLIVRSARAAVAGRPACAPEATPRANVG